MNHLIPSRCALAVTTGLILTAWAPAQSRFAQPGKKPLLFPPSVAGGVFADVDGDGDPDFVRGGNELYLNRGDGLFLPGPAGALPGLEGYEITAADLDGDGDVDLLLSKAFQPTLLLVNDGTGAFTDESSARMPVLAIPRSENAAAAADVDGDGDLDLVLAGGAPGLLFVNDGTGHFTDASATHLPASARSAEDVVVFDADADLDLDLLFLTGGTLTQYSLWVNDGSGHFVDSSQSLSTPLFFGFTISKGAVAGDLDGDGDEDLVISYYETRFAGAADFPPITPPSPAVNLILMNDGGTFYRRGSFLPDRAERTVDLDLGDMDGDGDLDLVVANNLSTEWRNRLYLNDGAGNFTEMESPFPALTESLSVDLVDTDGDGDLDVLMGLACREDLYYTNGGDADLTLANRGRVPLEDGAIGGSVAMGDVDGDADMDVLFSNGLFLSDGRGGFTKARATQFPPPDGRALALAFGDFDADGDLDLVFQESNRDPSSGLELGESQLYLNDGRGTFLDASATHMPSDTRYRFAGNVGDVDGDGDLDILLVGRDIRPYLNDGTARFSPAPVPAPLVGPTVGGTELADLDGDGDLDFVSVYAMSRTLYLNDGGGTFTEGTAGRLPELAANMLHVTSADVDGDGDLDLYLGSTSAHNDMLFLNDGAGHFTDVSATQLPADPVTTLNAVFGDLDRDGDLDILLAGRSNRIYLNDGTGTFTVLETLPTSVTDDQVAALGDMDGDGDLDLVVENKIWLNLHRQLEAPLNARIGMPYDLMLHAEPGYGLGPTIARLAIGLVPAAAPIPFPPYGHLRLDPASMVILPPIAVPATQDGLRLSLPVPSDPSLMGLELFSQALFFHGVPTFEVRLSGMVADVLGK